MALASKAGFNIWIAAKPGPASTPILRNDSILKIPTMRGCKNQPSSTAEMKAFAQAW
eukprot:CAMPEP_0116896748 /NCGR_PEP_ID=MMETSP0467-20121206/5922_1 /TAXON_ID=283647 /ORGANISM="Mesodinium pulex, Strain SPMC105" /LENGTH=56 /DNA_ID=CAMNT_0004568089 /DNA_START=939 /DNA_END=1106 /DNA_ORIENTATION=-